MDRPVTEEGLKKQIALMTGEMFAAVRSGDKALFDMAVAKGADVHARNDNGMPLLHVAVRRAVQDLRTDWLAHVLPYVDDLFVTNTKGYALFDDKLNDQLIPFRDNNYIDMLRKCRIYVMEQMPDIQAARDRLRAAEQGLTENRVLVAPRFNIVSAPERIHKPVYDDMPPPDKKSGDPKP